MAKPLPPYAQSILEILSEVRPVSMRNMFGGQGIYADGVMFGLIAYDTLYFKADEQSVDAFTAEASTPFTYEGKKTPVSMPYWRVPERLFDELDELAEWTEAAIQAAVRREEKKKR